MAKRPSFDEEEGRVAAKSVGKVENVTTAPGASDPLQLEAKSVFQDLKVAMAEYYFVKDTFLNELEHLHELETGFAPHQNVKLVLA